MPITEIVRVLARAPLPHGELELLYDVDGTARADEETVGWPQFWLRRYADGVLVHTLGPFATEDEASEAGEALGAQVWKPG